jgi:hypothetical protein
MTTTFKNDRAIPETIIKATMTKNDLDYLTRRFGIPESEILWYRSGICYDRIGVTTRESAMKVHDAVKGERVNGGMLDGMPLGEIFEVTRDGVHYFDVTC